MSAKKFRTEVECPICNGFKVAELNANDMGLICSYHRSELGLNSEYTIRHFRRGAGDV